MKIYLLMQGNRGEAESGANAFFFKRSAIAAAKRIREECGEWKSVTDHETDATDYWVTVARWMSIVPITLWFRDWTLKRWFRRRYHSQNLNEDRNGKIKGSILREGRAWFRTKPYGCREGGLEFAWSWHFWTHFWALQVDVGSGDSSTGIEFWIAFGLLSFHFEIEGLLPRSFIERGRKKALETKYLGYEYMAWPRSTGIRCFEQRIWFEIWNWDFGWSKDQPKWMSFNWSPVDFLLGKREYSSKNLLPWPKQESVLIPGEGAYPVEVMLTEDVWKRKRWPWPIVRRCADIKCIRPIPIPGKGENSWDCGEDAIHGKGCAATTVEEALGQLKESVLKTRERYGGKDWKPDLSTVR